MIWMMWRYEEKLWTSKFHLSFELQCVTTNFFSRRLFVSFDAVFFYVGLKVFLLLIIAALLQNPSNNTAAKRLRWKCGNNSLRKMKKGKRKKRKFPTDCRSHELSLVKYLCRQTGDLSLFMWFCHLSRRSTGEEASRKWPPQTFTTANCGRHLATGSTTATTCSPSPWRKISLHSSPWTAPATGENPQRSSVSSVNVSPT